MFGIVLMKVADMERFRKAVDEDPRERRALESLKSHKWIFGIVSALYKHRYSVPEYG